MRATTRTITAAALLAAISLWTAPLRAQGPGKLVKEYQGGKLYDCGGIRMAVLQGNYREMGRQYGALLKDDIIAFYDQMYGKCLLQTGLLSEEDLRRLVVVPALKTQAKRQGELLKGMSEMTGLPLEKHVLINLNILSVLYLRKMGWGNPGACTSMAAWGDYTTGGHTYTARNFDFPHVYRDLAKKFELLLVLKPTDGSNSVAGLCYTGMIEFQDVMNDKGLYVSWNNGAGSEGLVIYSDRAYIGDEMANMLFDSDNMDAFEGRLRTIRSGYPVIFLAAGPGEACYFENGTTDSKRRAAKEESLISGANQFLEPSWHIAPLKSPAIWYSDARQDNLESLARANKGKINESVLMKMLDEKLYNKDGSIGKGVSVIEKNPKDNEVTVHQVISCPSERKMWVRIPTCTDWILFDLSKVFGD